jgi:hypothetical protein
MVLVFVLCTIGLTLEFYRHHRKTDKYDNEIIYFKLRDKNVDLKFVTLIKPSYILPWFKSDKGHYILKVKTKYCKTKEFKKEEPIICDMTLYDLT